MFAEDNFIVTEDGSVENMQAARARSGGITSGVFKVK